MLGRRCPYLGAVEYIFVPVPNCGKLQRRQIGTRFGFAIALRPADRAVPQSGQPLVFLGVGSECEDHRPDIDDAHWRDRRGACLLELLVKNILLFDRPARAAKFFRPRARQPALFTQRHLGAPHFGGGQARAGGGLRQYVLRIFIGKIGPHLLAERLQFRIMAQFHGGPVFLPWRESMLGLTITEFLFVVQNPIRVGILGNLFPRKAYTRHR